MKINWKLRFKQVGFYIALIGALLTAACAGSGLKPEDITSWAIALSALESLVSNPYALACFAVVAYGIIKDYTTKGFGDTQKVLDAVKPISDEEAEPTDKTEA